jgi:hypothetical protein
MLHLELKFTENIVLDVNGEIIKIKLLKKEREDTGYSKIGIEANKNRVRIYREDNLVKI